MVLEADRRDGFELQIRVVSFEVIDIDAVILSVKEQRVVEEDHRGPWKGFCLFELVFLKKSIIGRIGD